MSDLTIKDHIKGILIDSINFGEISNRIEAIFKKEYEEKLNDLHLQYSKLSSAYISSLIFSGEVEHFLIHVQENSKNKFGACIYCKRNESLGHLENCPHEKIKKSLKDFKKNIGEREVKDGELD
jgi:hypothetical protein